MEIDVEKFDCLVHYICFKCEPAAKLGAVKLNKVLYYSDMLSFAVTGEPITGEIYIKRQHGPVPKHILASLKRLEQANKLVARKTSFFDYTKAEYVPLEEPNVRSFTPEELVLVDKMISFVCDNHTAREISELSHTAIWDSADIGEELPYETIFAAYAGELNEDDMAWAKKQAGKLNLVRETI